MWDSDRILAWFWTVLGVLFILGLVLQSLNILLTVIAIALLVMWIKKQPKQCAEQWVVDLGDYRDASTRMGRKKLYVKIEDAAWRSSDRRFKPSRPKHFFTRVIAFSTVLFWDKSCYLNKLILLWDLFKNLKKRGGLFCALSASHF